MWKTLILILIDKKKKNSLTVQKILTEWGYLIKKWLGIHDGVLENCSKFGLIILEWLEKKKNIKNFQEN